MVLSERTTWGNHEISPPFVSSSARYLTTAFWAWLLFKPRINLSRRLCSRDSSPSSSSLAALARFSRSKSLAGCHQKQEKTKQFDTIGMLYLLKILQHFQTDPEPYCRKIAWIFPHRSLAEFETHNFEWPRIPGAAPTFYHRQLTTGSNQFHFILHYFAVKKTELALSFHT